MKAGLPGIAGQLRLLAVVAVQALFVAGCSTAALWDKATFAHCYRPAEPPNLHLFYSQRRRDILVQYDESRDGASEVRARYYWLEPNVARVNRERRPHFVSPRFTEELVPILAEGVAAPIPKSGPKELHAVAGSDSDRFTLYSGSEELEQYKLPAYVGGSQKVKQVLLTPIAVGVDATVVGAVAAYYAAPGILSGLSR